MNSTSSRCWAEMDGAALLKNLRFLRTCLDSATGIIAIVKAEGFGHGMVRIAQELTAAGIEGLGVAHIHEAKELREAEIQSPILLLSAALPSEFPEILRLGCWPMISTVEEAQSLGAAAGKMGITAQAHFKMDTGMGRLGLWKEEASQALREILTLNQVNILAISTHFSQAESDPAFTQSQIKLFEEFRSQFPNLPFHISNSAATCQKLVSRAAYVRVGLALYGLPPLPSFKNDLVPVLTWKSRILLLRKLATGRTISYGATYRLPQPELLATVAVGYGDGYPRELSNKGFVLVGGTRCPIRGRVTMDQIIVDVSKVPTAQVEDEVVLIGNQGKQSITVDEIAAATGKISYEIITSVSARVQRVYKNWNSSQTGFG